MRWGGTAAVLAMAAVLSGCGSSGSEPDATAPEGDWLTSAAAVDTRPLVWESGGVVHLADGTEVDLGGAPSSYVVAGDGVFFAAAQSDEEAATGSDASADVLFAAPGEEPVDTGLELRADSLRASPDGRFLAGIDVVSGEEDQYGTPVAQVVVIDLREGREVLRSSDDMGDPADDDLADLYEEIPVGVARMTDETAYVDSAAGLLAVDLATGDAGDAGDVEVPVAGSPESPDGAWTLTRTDDVRAEVVGRDGSEVRLDVGAPQWTLDWWADASTVVGVAIAADGSSSLMTCTVPEGSCTTLEDTTGRTVRFVAGATEPAVVGLLGAGG